ncbi:MAG: hypothetical protein Q9202_005082 [Teloschistes flavicans]
MAGSPEIGNEAMCDPEIERRVLRKCDLHVLPILYTLYMLSYLDRINIGNARIEGLEKDLGMSGNDYNIAVQVLFVPYILLEVPSNIMLKRVAPSTWLSLMMFVWGITTMCQGLVSSFGGLVACRFLLGCFEAGLAPGNVYLIAMYYKRYEMQKRYTFYNTAGIIAGAFGGFLAYALAKMDGLGGYAGWRWIFIIEGLLTSVVAIIAKWLIVDWPEEAKFLNGDERAVLLQRLKEDEGFAKMDTLDRKSLQRTLSDWKIWVGGLMYLGTTTSTYSVSYYLPTVLKEFGYTSSAAQVQTIPIYAAGLVVAFLTAWSSDRFRHRFGFVILGATVNAVGYMVLLAQRHVRVKIRYMALYLVECGLWIGSPVEIVWITSNLGGHYKRALGSAIVVASGNMSGFIASNVFITNQAPRYPVGYGVALGMTVFAATAATVLFLGLRRENKRRDRGGRDYRLQCSKEVLDNMGDDHPGFRYGL